MIFKNTSVSFVVRIVIGWILPPPTFSIYVWKPPVPENVNAFQNKTFKEVTELKWGFRLDPNPEWLVPLWEEIRVERDIRDATRD